MLCVKLQGRLGNQMFQYAFAYSLAAKFHTFCIIKSETNEDVIKKYFKVNKYINNKITQTVLYFLFQIKLSLVKQNGDEQKDTILPYLNNNRTYDGFFQSENYFTNILHSINKRFEIKRVYQKAFYNKHGDMFRINKVLVIHFRLTDYFTWGNENYGGINLALPEEYYTNALKQIVDLDSYKIIIVTDDREMVKGFLPELKERTIISDTEIMDFQMLMHADELIISNSTFAWWAAYLNIKKAKVYAPEFWIGFKIKKELPVNIIPNNFIKVSF